MKPSVLLRNLFLATSLFLTTKGSDAQTRAAKNERTAPQTTTQTTTQTVPQSTRGETYRENEKKVENVAAARTGLLFIRGPEIDPGVAAWTDFETHGFQETFRKLPVEIIGNGTDSISLDTVTARLDELAGKDIDNIIIVTAMHGDRIVKTDAPFSSLGLSGDVGFTTENSLLYKYKGPSDKASFDANDLYGAIAAKFETDEKLHDKHLIVVHQSCFGGAALDAFLRLKPGTDVFFYASSRDVSWSARGNNAFPIAYNQMLWEAVEQELAPPPLTERTALAAAFMASHSTLHNQTPANSVNYLKVLDEKPDTLQIAGKNFHLGTHKGLLVQPDSLRREVFERFTDKEILSDMKEFEDMVPSSRLSTAVTVYRMFGEDFLEGLTPAVYDRINFVTAQMALKHPELLETAAEHAVRDKAMGVEKNPPSSKGPSF